MPSPTAPHRRDFLKTAAATGITLAAPSLVRAADANSALSLGLIGCGGRGNFIADLVHENGNAKITALHDYFQDRVDSIGQRLSIPPSNRYVGLDGYVKLIEESKVDGVLIISPPYFHPEQAVAALKHGKHVYLAKPIAVDVPGAHAITHAADAVKDRLSCWVDFQTRVDPYYQGAAQHLFDGMIGKPFLGQAYYYSDRLKSKWPPGTETARLRNWVFDKTLSGDIIVEQNIHAIDVANWLLRSHPLKASGTGGRKVRTDVGDCWDHFLCTFFYPDDVSVSFSSRQAGFGPGGIICNIFCQTGAVLTEYAGKVSVVGQRGNYKGGFNPDLYRTGAAENLKRFIEAVHTDRPINNVQESANSTITAILGRAAAYNQTTVTWDDLIAANLKLDPHLTLPPDGPKSIT
jgi:myo-inositol 2-dehydrogenase / D-chiro-inositol 1-dehydrogenase